MTRLPDDKSFHVYLDLLRGLSAMMVVIHHAKVLRIGPTLFLAVAPALGHQFVVVFFVLSGYVIASAVDRKRNSTLTTYALDRVARIYSVAVPALLFSLLVSLLIAEIAGAGAGGTGTTWQLVSGFLANLVPVGQSWNLMIVPPDNPPFWSLCYEVIFYAIFGCVHYLRGKTRIALLAALCLFAGPKVLLMFPCWLAGVALFHWRNRLPLTRIAAAAVAWGMPVVVLATASHFRLAQTMGTFTKSSFGGLYPALEMSDSFAFDFLLAACIATHLYGMRYFSIRWPLRIVAWGEALAAVSFSLYLLHYPLWLLLANAFPVQQKTWPYFGAAVIAMGVMTWAFAYATEWRRPMLRRALDRLFGTGRVPPPAGFVG